MVEDGSKQLFGVVYFVKHMPQTPNPTKIDESGFVDHANPVHAFGISDYSDYSKHAVCSNLLSRLFGYIHSAPLALLLAKA